MSGPCYLWAGNSIQWIRFPSLESYCSVNTIRREIKTILKDLQGSPWALQAPVREVIEEYKHFAGAWKTLNQTRRVSLQIFHASRAIDSLLAHIVQHEASKPGRPAPRGRNLGSYHDYIRRNRIGGITINPSEDHDVRLIRNDRNSYLHQANFFPNEGVIRQFIACTGRVVQAALRFPP